jgi:CheY-like chemotaxis protein
MGDGIGRVVVVDDDEDWRELVVQFLEESGYDAVGYADGREALAVLRRRDGTPTVVLLDLEMPAMTGWEFRRQQLADPRLAPIPVVVASAADPGTIDADAYLAKPYGPVELRRTLERLSGRARATRLDRPAA